MQKVSLSGTNSAHCSVQCRAVGDKYPVNASSSDVLCERTANSQQQSMAQGTSTPSFSLSTLTDWLTSSRPFAKSGRAQYYFFLNLRLDMRSFKTLQLLYGTMQTCRLAFPTWYMYRKSETIYSFLILSKFHNMLHAPVLSQSTH